MHIDLSVIIPSINPNTWSNLFHQLKESTKGYNFELIAVGPNLPSPELQGVLSFRYVRDFGSPSRAFQIGSTIANGKFLAFIPDDCIIDGYTFGECIGFAKSNQWKQNDGMILKYSEGPNYSGVQHLQQEYWVAHTHPSLRMKQVNSTWKIAPCFMYGTEFFRSIGGLNCQWEHVNMNTHDLAFRAQRLGGELHYSSKRVFASNWHPWDNNNKSPIQLAYEENDNPLFQKVYDNDLEPSINIPYNNWEQAPAFWPRRYKVE